jgi:hypothetical protein
MLVLVAIFFSLLYFMLVIGGYGVLLVVVALPLPKFAITFLILMIRQFRSF